MDSVILEARITLDSGLLSQHVVIFTLKVFNDLGKAKGFKQLVTMNYSFETGSSIGYLASLSIWSPKPGVSTIVSDIRVPPSSSSSRSTGELGRDPCNVGLCRVYEPTVTGLIFTPSSIWALVGSSESLPWRTFLPQSVFTKVVRPEKISTESNNELR